MIYIFQAKTDQDEIVEGYAHNKEEASEKIRTQLPDVKDFELFFGGNAPQTLTIKMYRDMIAMGFPKQIIMEMDHKLTEYLDEELES